MRILALSQKSFHEALLKVLAAIEEMLAHLW
jgi:hypothetical protein